MARGSSRQPLDDDPPRVAFVVRFDLGGRQRPGDRHGPEEMVGVRGPQAGDRSAGLCEDGGMPV